ncbi:acetamidase/formamidase family protein [Frankia tisae]|uniref:acetamidase/formamidase family protein n=1 Tax=Frankia tisae TaxID=2950104 RepID=UPI0021C1D95B|nr:acetamidase/formamidase family protein [Frankia tisae]
MALQPGRGKIEGKHYLPSTPETVTWGELPNALTRPVLSIDSGATVTFDTVSSEGILGDQGRDPDAFLANLGVPPSEVLADARAIAASGLPHRFGVDAPHIVTGPVLVRGAQPGDVLRVDVLSLHPRARYGIVSTRHGVGLLAGEFPEGGPPESDADARHWQRFRTVTTFCAVERRRGRLYGSLASASGGRARFPLAPFLGVMAVAVDSTTEVIASTATGLHGGALDCRDLGTGARLYLPVQVGGALFAVGDPHYALGDGKIGGTALEGPLRATLRLTALRETAARAALGALREPFIETDAMWVTMGLDADLTEAIRRATRSAVLFLQSRVGLERAEALAYLTAAADIGVCRLGSGAPGAFCRIHRSDFAEPAAAKPRLHRPPFTRIVGAADAGDSSDGGHSDGGHSDGGRDDIERDPGSTDPPGGTAQPVDERAAPDGVSGVSGAGGPPP